MKFTKFTTFTSGTTEIAEHCVVHVDLGNSAGEDTSEEGPQGVPLL